VLAALPWRPGKGRPCALALGLHREVAGGGGRPQDPGQEGGLCRDGSLPVGPASGWDEAEVSAHH